MRFFSALTEELTSPLPPAELLRRLQAEVQQACAFASTVATTSFTLTCVINYRIRCCPAFGAR